MTLIASTYAYCFATTAGLAWLLVSSISSVFALVTFTLACGFTFVFAVESFFRCSLRPAGGKQIVRRASEFGLGFILGSCTVLLSYLAFGAGLGDYGRIRTSLTALNALAWCLSVGASEECMFRLAFQRVATRLVGPASATLVQVSLFVMAHQPWNGEFVGLHVAFLTASALAFTALALRLGVYSAIGLHTALNWYIYMYIDNIPSILYAEAHIPTAAPVMSHTQQVGAIIVEITLLMAIACCAALFHQKPMDEAPDRALL